MKKDVMSELEMPTLTCPCAEVKWSLKAMATLILGTRLIAVSCLLMRRFRFLETLWVVCLEMRLCQFLMMLCGRPWRGDVL